MKVFITAGSGVGKTTVIHELLRRGYRAYDADDRALGLTRFEVKMTGEEVDWPTGYIDWHHYAWNANEARLEELLAGDDPVFVAGFLGNKEQLYHYFDTLIALSVDAAEHEHRLRTRPKREVGDDELNIQERIKKYPTHMAKLAQSNFLIVDNNRPIEQTVDHILRIISE